MRVCLGRATGRAAAVRAAAGRAARLLLGEHREHLPFLVERHLEDGLRLSLRQVRGGS